MVDIMYEITTKSRKNKNVIGDVTIIMDGRLQLDQISMIQTGAQEDGVFLSFPDNSLNQSRVTVLSKAYIDAFTTAAYFSLKHHGEPYYIHLFENQMEPWSYIDMQDRIADNPGIPESVKNTLPEMDLFSYGDPKMRYNTAAVFQRYFGNGVNHRESIDIHIDKGDRNRYSLQIADAVICSNLAGLDLRRSAGNKKEVCSILQRDFKLEVKAKLQKEHEKLQKNRLSR